VDDYPRAFSYRVPLGTSSINLPEEIDLLEIRITAPPAGQAYRAPVAPLAVAFEVDAPPDGFQSARDVVELGIDEDRDRDFRDEPTMRFESDRQVAAWLDHVAPEGVIAIESKVSDFQVELPVPDVGSARVGVLARLFVAGKTAWSEPREIIVDGGPPVIERIELKPAEPLVAGAELEVAARVNDHDLSGVAKVEAALDTLELGKFAEDPKPVPLVLQSDGSWTAKLPTADLKAGGCRLLVQATDKVGNVSSYSSVKVLVITADEAKAAQLAKYGRVNGTVFFGGQPMEEIEVLLEPEKGPKLGPVKTDTRGAFLLEQVSPGKYKLKAKGVIHNKIRKAEQEITIAPPARTAPVRVDIK
jgi:hypothetical protein